MFASEEGCAAIVNVLTSLIISSKVISSLIKAVIKPSFKLLFRTIFHVINYLQYLAIKADPKQAELGRVWIITGELKMSANT